MTTKEVIPLINKHIEFLTPPQRRTISRILASNPNDKVGATESIAKYLKCDLSKLLEVLIKG
jgi:hypothetical protein